MMTRWMPTHALTAHCPACRTLVHARFEYRTITLARTRLRVSKVLVDVCPHCDATIAVPRQALAQLREAGAK